MKTLFSIVVDSLERETLHYVHNKQHLWFFFRWLTGIETVNYNTELFLAMFEEKQIKFYFTLMSVQCIANGSCFIWVKQVSPHYKVTFDTPFIFKLLYMYMYEVAGTEIHLDH